MTHVGQLMVGLLEVPVVTIGEVVLIASTPLLVRLSVPPNVTELLPVKPGPRFTAIDGVCNIAFVMPPAVMLKLAVDPRGMIPVGGVRVSPLPTAKVIELFWSATFGTVPFVMFAPLRFVNPEPSPVSALSVNAMVLVAAPVLYFSELPTLKM